MVKISFIAACLIAFFGSICTAEPGGVMWTARYLESQSGIAQAITCQGSRVFAAGQTWPIGQFDRDAFALVAYEARTGEPAWTANGPEGSVAMAVKAAFGRVYMAGTRTGGPDLSPMFVNAHNTSNGKPLWNRLWPTDRSGIANCIALDASGSRIFVAGSTDGGIGQPYKFFSVLALNAMNGKLVWEQSREGTQAKKGNAHAIAVDSGRVFAVGMFSDDQSFKEGFAVRAYTMSGQLLWEDVQWSEGKGSAGAYLHSYATAVTTSFNRVYVAGTIHSNNGGGSFVVRVYDAVTGTLVWEDRYNYYKYFHDVAYAVVLNGTRLFAGGYVTQPSSGTAFTVRAYDAAKGTLLWSNRSGGFNIEDSGVSALASTSGTVYGAGTGKDGTAFTVRAYKTTTGEILWEDFLPQDGIIQGFGEAFGACTMAGSVFAGGAAMMDDTTSTFTVRAYSGR